MRIDMLTHRIGLMLLINFGARPSTSIMRGGLFKLKRVLGDPRPAHAISIINAASSGEGRAFATRNADILFTSAIDLTCSKPEIAELKKLAKESGREVGVLTLAHVVCRPTEQEAKDYVKYYAETNADWGGVDRLMELQFAHAKSFPLDLLAGIRSSMAVGQGGYQLIGTPQMVADGIMRLKECGFNRTTLSFVDYVKEFPYFRDNILPLLGKAGINSGTKRRHKGALPLVGESELKRESELKLLPYKFKSFNY
jgi:FMNH2-dependent dimethyl sulfone monooxygenase